MANSSTYADAFRRSVKDRLELLGLLRLGGGRAVLLLLLNIVVAVIPGATAMATASLAASLTSVIAGSDNSGVATVAGPLTAMTVLLVALELGLTLRYSVADDIAPIIDSRIRSQVRLSFQSSELSRIESAAFGDEASRASENANLNGYIRSVGQAATSQLTLIFRFVSILIGAVVVAQFSIALAVALVAVGLITRAFALKAFMGLASIRNERWTYRRRANYWAVLGTDSGPGKELRLFGLGDWLAGRHRQEMDAYLGGITPARTHMFRVNWVLAVPRTLAAAVALALPGIAVSNGEVSIAVLVQTVVAGLAVLDGCHLGGEAMQIAYGRESLTALGKLTRGFEGEPGPEKKGGDSNAPHESHSEPHKSGGLVISNISFSYPHSKAPVIDGLSLTIPPHQILAIVGRNGVGKTTLIKLLTGLYVPSSGNIMVEGLSIHFETSDSLTVNGTGVAQKARSLWERRCAVVFQDFNRYPLSLKANVALQAPEFSDDTDGITEALLRAGALEMALSLPQGLDTLLSRERSGGTELSGGQWQKIALARALFAVAHGRDFLVLDEPTAQLDVEAEAHFYENLVSAVRGRATVILISHRLSTVRPADRIIVLDESGVAEDGTHAALIDNQGIYAEAFNLQAHRFRDDSTPQISGEESSRG